MKRIMGLAITVVLLVACGNSDPLGGNKDAGGDSSSITIGSANFPEAQIIAEVYAQALEAKGVTVDRRMQIGARDVYIAALKDGSVDLVPEYTGNLLQYFKADAAAKTSKDVTAELEKAMPKDFFITSPAPAENKDSYNVTEEFAKKHNVSSLADLRQFDGTLKIGGNPELAERPYGPKGLTSVYGVAADRITFVALSDGGGPLTVKALAKGDVDVADIFSTTPSIADNGFVTLADPENLIVAQNVVPLVSSRVSNDVIKKTLNEVSAKLTTDDLTAMNKKNQGDEKASPDKVAKEWLRDKGLA